MRIYIDVTNLIRVTFVTGIQRVVREVVLRMLRKEEFDVVLMNYNEGYQIFESVDVSRFTAYFERNEGEKSEIVINRKIDLNQMQPGDVFFDIDSVWNLPLRRSVLLPELKANGVKIAVYVYDIIPITHPQYCHGQTVYKFMNYIGAYLQYADLIIASAQSTLDAIDELLDQLELPHIPGVVSWLGSDFSSKTFQAEDVAEEAQTAVEAGRYVLMIGTIEPRKNHTLVLDAFDNRLFDQGVNLILAGKIGWNVDTLQKRIESHPMLHKQLFFLEGMNDATIDYLYKHAFCVAFPTFNEGFGLPIIEAFQRGTPVLASDIPILREVGGENCAYFDLASWENFANGLEQWIQNPEQYEIYKNRVNQYQPVTWDTVSDTISDALISVIRPYPYSVPDRVRQMVYLTARIDDLLASLPFVEHFMPFIEELVLCCPDSMPEEMKKRYTGRMQIKYLTDSELLDGQELPKDHAKRNFFLRCQAIRKDVLDDVFIMADDDYRPLYQITSEIYLHDGKYIGYYCYNLEDWKGDQSTPTSFDLSMFYTRDFLKEHGYSTRMYDSHMPQIIDRRGFLEMLDKYPGIDSQGLSDWSMYFNYMSTTYGDVIENRPYVTMSWPGMPSGWDMMVYPEQLIFENYYSELYEDGELFADCSKTYYDGIEHENMDKIVRYMKIQADHNHARVMFKSYCAGYEMRYGEYPMFYIHMTEEQCVIMIPQYVMISENNFTRIPFMAETLIEEEGTYELSYRILDFQDSVLLQGETMVMPLQQKYFELPVKGTYGGVRGILEISVKYGEVEHKEYTKLFITRKGI
ncbi:MAG: glycosyltransferase family 4 protein [Lachnospiraceae bacterium]|nr:glycosyltransferase family 4 protein [Lachnospiraceae bacterium]